MELEPSSTHFEILVLKFAKQRQNLNKEFEFVLERKVSAVKTGLFNSRNKLEIHFDIIISYHHLFNL